MTEFQYAGTTSDGKPCQGSIRAPDEQAARLRLLGQGITPVRIAGAGAALAQDAATARSARLKRSDVLLFSREMAHLKQGNMPLDKALAMLKETANTERLRIFIGKVEQGAIEASNVDAADESIRLMELTRHVESVQRAISIYDKAMETGINRLGEN